MEKKIVNEKRQSITQLIVAIIGIFISTFAVTMFNQHLMMKFPLELRMLLMIISNWALMLFPIILIKKNKESLKDYWKISGNISIQIFTGIVLALLMSAIFTLLPIFLGFREMLGETSYTQLWQFIFEFVYMIFGVALAEEFIFRGYIFHKILEIKDSRWFAIIVSSILFGLFHIFQGNLIQVIMTSLLGILFCVLRKKKKNCTLLSLVIVHGMYNALIRLWLAVL